MAAKGMSIYKWNDESPDNRTNYPNISTADKIKPKLYQLKRNMVIILEVAAEAKVCCR